MKKQGILSLVLSMVLLFQLFTINTTVVSGSIANDLNSTERMKGVWVSSVANLDYPLKQTTDSDYLKSQADEIVANCKELGFNAVFLQVRPTSDALYKSEIFPWSKYLTGSQGTAPDNGFDPLEYWITKCHENGIELHAWINPYRITRDGKTSIQDLANSNPAKQHPEYTLRYSDGNFYYDPAMPQVRQILVDGVLEIINNYDVDGIHMDDYFYPGQDFDDDDTYALYGKGMDKGDWRRENVNTLIKQLHDEIKATGKDVAFGISPSGVWANKGNNELGSNTRGSESYYNLYADTRKWAREEWIDYICPQIYWEIGHSAADYDTLVKWWVDAIGNADTKLYVGLADYKCDGVSSSSVWYNGKAIQQQFDLNKSISRVAGEVHFRYQLITKNAALCNIIKSENSDGSTITPVRTTEGTTQAVTEAETQLTTQSVDTNDAQTTSTTQFDPKSVVNNDPVKVLVYVNGERVEFDQEPVIKNSRTLVPFRKIFEALGAEVKWNDDTQQVLATLGNKEISLIIGQKVMLVDKADTVALDVAPEIMGSRTMVPLRAISETLGADVQWYNDNRVITIDLKE